MTLEEARGELGVAAEAAPEVVRRAYLRLLKTRKPEVDPQGFARLREAYDFLKAAQEGSEAPRTQAAPEVPTASPAPADPSAPQTPDQRLEAFRLRFRALPADAPAELPIQVAREAVEALPEVAEARHWLIRALLVAERRDEAIQAFRDAFRQGHPEFLPGFAQSFPEHLTEAELELLGAMVQPSFLWEMANHLSKIFKWTQMGRVLRVAFEALQRHPETPPPQPAWFLSMMLLLHENAHPQEARELQGRYAAWVKAQGLEEVFQKENVAWAWPLILELSALGDACPPEVRAAMARAVLSNELNDAQKRLRDYQSREPARAAEALALLQAQCPQFYKALGSSTPLAPVTRAKSPKPATYVNGAVSISALIFLLLRILFWVFSGGARSSSVPEQPPPEPVPESLIVRETRAFTTALCQELPASNRVLRCSRMERLLDALGAGDCVYIESNYARIMSEMTREMDSVPTPTEFREPRAERIQRARASLEATLRKVCPASL
jgi:hypothetical protein